jgi:hypothetical protein
MYLLPPAQKSLRVTTYSPQMPMRIPEAYLALITKCVEVKRQYLPIRGITLSINQ